MDLAAYLNPETLQKLQTGGYVLMLGLMILEGPIVTFIASFLASIGFFDFFIVLMLGWAGDILGDVLYFSLGRFGIQFFTKTHKKGPEKNSDFLSRLDSLIHSNLFLSIFVVKFTPYIQPLGLTFVGKSDISFRRYMLYSTLLCIPIPLAFGMTGYYLGQINNVLSNHTKGNIIATFILAICIIILCVVLGWFLLKKSKKVLSASHGDKN